MRLRLGLRLGLRLEGVSDSTHLTPPNRIPPGTGPFQRAPLHGALTTRGGSADAARDEWSWSARFVNPSVPLCCAAESSSSSRLFDTVCGPSAFDDSSVGRHDSAHHDVAHRVSVKVITHGRRQFLALFVPYVYWGKWVGRLVLILSRSADIATDIATGLRRGVIDPRGRGGVAPGKRTPLDLFSSVGFLRNQKPQGGR